MSIAIEESKMKKPLFMLFGAAMLLLMALIVSTYSVETKPDNLVPIVFIDKKSYTTVASTISDTVKVKRNCILTSESGATLSVVNNKWLCDTLKLNFSYTGEIQNNKIKFLKF